MLAGSAFAQQTLPPLRTGVDGTYAPHAMPKLGGGLEGFQIDLFNEVARRMHREITIELASFSGLIPALQAGRYDFLAAPTTVTPERAKRCCSPKAISGPHSSSASARARAAEGLGAT